MRASLIKRFQLATSKRGRPRAIRILVAFLIWNVIGRMEFEIRMSNQSKSAPIVRTRVGNAKERRRNSILRLQCSQTRTFKPVRESSLFCQFETMDPTHEDYDYRDNMYCTHNLSGASERARNLVERSKLATRKRGRSTVTTILVSLLIYFIRRFFSIALWLGTFKLGAHGFAVV